VHDGADDRKGNEANDSKKASSSEEEAAALSMDDEPTKEEGTLATATTEDDKTTPLITSFVPDGILQDYADRYLKEHHSKRWNENASHWSKRE